MKKILVGGVVILLLALLSQYDRDKNRNVNTKIDGFIIDVKDSSYAYRSLLSIDGEIREGAGEPTVFEGNFSFSNLPPSVEKLNDVVTIFMATRKKYQPSVIPKINYAVDIFSLDDFKKILMQIYPIGENDTTLYFVGPAKSAEEAKKLANELVKDTRYDKALYFKN